MIVEVSRVSKFYVNAGKEPLQVLKDVSFTLHEQEFICVIGPSGCGKSTLLRMLANLSRPDSGHVRFSGRRRATGPVTTVVWQDYALIPWRTVLDNVAFGLEVRRVDKKTRQARARDNLRIMGIEGFADHHPYQLSGGMQQRAGIARALTNDPEVLLMDEPFGAVDAQTRAVLQEELLTVWDKDKKSVVFVTHNIEEALLMADRVFVLGPRPATILEEIVVPFERPRTMEMEASPDFVALRLHIWELLKPGMQDQKGNGVREGAAP